MNIERLLADAGGRRCPRRLISLAPVYAWAALLALCGCGTKTNPTVGTITLTNSSGVAQPAITSLAHGTAAYFDVTVTNDREGLGVDWVVTCSSSLPTGTLPAGMVDTSCGTFSLYHTASGPATTPPIATVVTQYTAPLTVPAAGTVTIVAHATSHPESVSTLTLTIP